MVAGHAAGGGRLARVVLAAVVGLDAVGLVVGEAVLVCLVLDRRRLWICARVEQAQLGRTDIWRAFSGLGRTM